MTDAKKSTGNKLLSVITTVLVALVVLVAVMLMGARVIGLGVAKTCVDEFLNTEFDGGRHKSRVENIMKIEREQ